jgi:hypothetical protein
MPTLREELEPLRRLVKGGDYAVLKAMIEFIDAADRELKTLDNVIARRVLALLDQQVE